MATRLERSIVASPLGRRVLGLFLVCTLLPCAVYGLYSDQQLRTHLLRQQRDRLQDEARAAGHRLHDRLLAIGSALPAWAERFELAERSGVDPRAGGTFPFSFRDAWTHVPAEFPKVAPTEVHSSKGAPRRAPVVLMPDEWSWVRGGETLLRIEPEPGGKNGIFRWVRALPGEGAERVLVVEQEIGEVMAEELEFLTGEILVIRCAGEPVLRAGAELSAEWDGTFEGESQGPDPMRRRLDDEEIVGSTWTLALRYAFGCRPMTVAVAAPLGSILEPLHSIRRTYILIAALIALLVVLLSARQARRILEPLRQLCRGTERLAEGELSGRIRIETGDEFELLARDFNEMAGQIERQFETSELFGAINNSVLSCLEIDAIVETILSRLPSLVSGASVTVVEFVTSDSGEAHRHDEPGRPGRPIAERGTVTTRLHGVLSAQTDPWIEVSPKTHWIVEALGLDEKLPQVIFPMLAPGRLVGAISIAGTALDPRGLQRVRRVADQCLVALENARLMAQFDRMSWGTLHTLARAVDAKSSWTAGHSERVARVARGVAAELGLGPKDQERIFRGGLLHDVGKIGTPVEILDKPGPLTAKEKLIMEEHVILGVKILEPIDEYAALLPMVRSHHERWDGKGYPDGLGGTMIPLDARIVQVADVFDAMTNDRPFREGMEPSLAMGIILKGVHSQFDPDCTQALWMFLAKDTELGPLQLEGEPAP